MAMSLALKERALLLGEFAEWITFVTDLSKYGEQIWNQSVAEGKWSVREVVAHILQWDDYFFEEAVAKVAKGLSLTVKHLDYDEFNMDAKQYGKSASPDELTEHAVRSRQRILDVLAGLSEQQYLTSYVDADGHPFEAAQYIKDFIWHDRHHIAQIKNRLFSRIEEMSLNGWPALQTVVYDGWLLRFAEGYTKRSNSISAIYGGTIELDKKIGACEQYYEQRDQRAIFKITPFTQPANLDEKLSERGYAIIDHSLVKTVHLADVKAPSAAEVTLENELTDAWLDLLALFNGLTESQREVTRVMMKQSPLKKCFATLSDNGVPVACGMAVLEDGWIGLYDIVTKADKRSKGHGEELVLHLLEWAKRQGATEGYLLVVKDNLPANRLYDKIGYKHQYDYWYRVME